MGNTLTACTSGNREDRIPNNNAPTERPTDVKGEPNPEQSSFVKNINIRKSLRAARKSVAKPFKKQKAGNGKEGEPVFSSDDTHSIGVNQIPQTEPTTIVVTHEEAKVIVDSSGGKDKNLSVEVIQVEVTKVEAGISSGEQEKDKEPRDETIEEEVDNANDSHKANEQGAESKSICNEVVEQEILDAIEGSQEKEDSKEVETDAPKVADAADTDLSGEKVDETDGDESIAKEENISGIAESLFNKYDKDGSGSLSKREIKKLLKEELGLDREEAQIMQLLIDGDDTKNVSLEEFQEFMAKEDNVKIVKDSNSYKLLAEVERWFKQSDTDGSGTLDKEELGNLLKTNLGIPPEEADNVLVQFDTSGDKEIGFKELVKFLPPTAHLLP